MTQTQGFGLANGDDLYMAGYHFADGFQYVVLALGAEHMFQLEVHIEMVFDGFFSPACHQNDFFDAGTDGFFHHMLDHGFVAHRQQFLGDGFGGWQHACAETGDGKDRLADW